MRVAATPALAQALFVKLGDVSVRKPDRALELGVYGLPGVGQLGFAHLQRPGSELGSVKFTGELNQSRIALGRHPLHNRPRTHLNFRIKQTRGRTQAVQFAVETGISMTERFHGPAVKQKLS